MTERKPPGGSFESWIDRQIREAQARGEFDNLPGAGKPIPGADDPYDELWWVKNVMRREDLTFMLPTGLALRKEAEDILHAAAKEATEDGVRALVADLNTRIVEANRKPPEGPPVNLMPLDVDRVVRAWREHRAEG